MNVLCKTIYLSQEDDGLYLLDDGDSLPTLDWKDENTPNEQFMKYFNLDLHWVVIELVDTETKGDTISIIFVCILPPSTELLAGTWKTLKKEEFNVISSPILYKAMQKLQ